MPSPLPPRLPTGTVATTVRVAASITDTLLSSAFSTYTLVPTGFVATPDGARPTATVPTTALVARSITVTTLALELGMYANGAAMTGVVSVMVNATAAAARRQRHTRGRRII